MKLKLATPSQLEISRTLRTETHAGRFSTQRVSRCKEKLLAVRLQQRRGKLRADAAKRIVDVRGKGLHACDRGKRDQSNHQRIFN